MDALWHYHDPAYRRARLNAYRCRDRALHRVAERIASPGPLPDPAQSNVVVGLGSWSVTGANSGGAISFKGGGAPTGRLVKLLRERYVRHVLVIDEYLTSQVRACVLKSEMRARVRVAR